MAFTKKQISVSITLAQGQFGETGKNQITIDGLRVAATINAYNGDAQGQLQCQIWGLPLSVTNQLTTMGPIMNQMRNNRITISAGEQGQNLPLIYEGSISHFAYAELNAAPEVPFNILSMAGAYEALSHGKNRSYPNSVKAADIMADLAKEMGKPFENNGVDAVLPKGTAYYGSPLTQVKEVARDANIYWTLDRGTLAIWPKKSGYRQGDPIKIGPDTGMVGYPCLASNGLIVTSQFNPEIKLGGRVEVNSSLAVANGVWGVYRVSHSIESEMVGGAWFTQTLCYRPDWIK